MLGGGLLVHDDVLCRKKAQDQRGRLARTDQSMQIFDDALLVDDGQLLSRVDSFSPKHERESCYQ